MQRRRSKRSDLQTNGVDSVVSDQARKSRFACKIVFLVVLCYEFFLVWHRHLTVSPAQFKEGLGHLDPPIPNLPGSSATPFSISAFFSGRDGEQASRRAVIDIVIPFRNRTAHFAKYYDNFILHTKNKNWDARIIVVEQMDSLPFRRGWLLNVGMRIAMESRKFLGVGDDRPPPDCIITSDVDMLPEPTVDFADCRPAPTQFCAEVEQFGWGLPYHTYSGGVVGATPAGWSKFNGFSNRGKGWGGEDDVLFARVEQAGLLGGEEGYTIFGPKKAFRRPAKNRGRCRSLSEGHTGRNKDGRGYKEMLVILSRHNRGDAQVDLDGISTVSFEEVKQRQKLKNVVWLFVGPGKQDPYYDEVHREGGTVEGRGKQVVTNGVTNGNGAFAAGEVFIETEERKGEALELGDDCGCFKGTVPIQDENKKCQPFQPSRGDFERLQRTEQGWNFGAFPMLVTAKWIAKQKQWVVAEQPLQQPHPSAVAALAELKNRPTTADDLRRLNGGMPTPEEVLRADSEVQHAGGHTPKQAEHGGRPAAGAISPARVDDDDLPPPAVCAEVLGGTVILGVLITAEEKDLAIVELHRATVGRASHPCVRIFYVIGAQGLTAEEKKPVLAANKTHNDFLFLENTKENMNLGKSLDWIDFAIERFGASSYESPRAAAFLGKLDLDAFLHSRLLVRELSKLPRKMLFYGGEAAHLLEDGRLGTHNVYEGVEFCFGDTKLVGELYVLSLDLALLATRGKHWKDGALRNGDEDTIVSNQLYWSVDQHALAGEVDRFHFVSDWYRLVDHPFMTTRLDVSRNWIQPVGRHSEVLILHQVKTKWQWKNVNQWLDRTKNGTTICAVAT